MSTLLQASAPSAAPAATCFSLAADLSSARERVRRMNALWQTLAGYADFQDRSGAQHAQGRCPGMQAHAADRAYAAEAAYRLLANEALNAVNDLRDAGELQPALRRFANRVGTGLDTDAIVGLIRLAGAETAGDVAELSPAFMEEVAAQVRLTGMTLGVREDHVVVAFRPQGQDGGQVAFPLRAVAGTPRLGGADLFAARSAGQTSSLAGLGLFPFPSPRPAGLGAGTPVVDLYAGLTAALAGGREIMYRNARKADEEGEGELSGSFLPALIIVGMLVVGVLLIAGGVTLKILCDKGVTTGKACDYWWFLVMLGSMLVGGALLGPLGAIGGGTASYGVMKIAV